MKRVIWGVLMIVSVFILPWWIVFLLCLASLFYFERFYEVIIIALIADVIYGSYLYFGYPYLITLTSVLIFYTISRFKNNLIAY